MAFSKAYRRRNTRLYQASVRELCPRLEMRQRLSRVTLYVIGKRRHPFLTTTAVMTRIYNVILLYVITSSLVLDWAVKEGPIGRFVWWLCQLP